MALLLTRACLPLSRLLGGAYSTSKWCKSDGCMLHFLSFFHGICSGCSSGQSRLAQPSRHAAGSQRLTAARPGYVLKAGACLHVVTMYLS